MFACKRIDLAVIGEVILDISFLLKRSRSVKLDEALFLGIKLLQSFIDTLQPPPDTDVRHAGFPLEEIHARAQLCRIEHEVFDRFENVIFDHCGVDFWVHAFCHLDPYVHLGMVPLVALVRYPMNNMRRLHSLVRVVAAIGEESAATLPAADEAR